MIENQPQTLNSQIPRAFMISFPYRRTGMGGFDDNIVLSFRTRKPVKSILRTSRSGNHGTRSYRLLPSKYLLYSVNRSNGGNLYGSISIVTLQDTGELKTEKEWQVFVREPRLTLNDLPPSIRTLLVENKDQLPLFNYIFPFDQQDNQEGM
jgi:hypothetical protein